MPSSPRRNKTRSKGRRKPKQARSKATVEAILIATAQILEREGPEAATTNAIARRAGVSIGSLYQYFSNREALLEALARRHVEQMRGILTAEIDRFGDAPLEDAVAALIGALLEALAVNPRLDQALHRLVPLSSAGILDAFEDSAVALVSLAVRARPELEIEAPEHAARILVTAIGGLIRTTLRLRPHSVAEPAFEAALVDLVLGFIDRQAGGAAA